jgi:polyhydroxyalkanoate synthesis regulator phasin
VSTGSDISWLIAREKAVRDEAREAMLSSLNALESGSLAYDLAGMLNNTRMLETDGKAGQSNRFFTQAAGLIVPRMEAVCSLSSAIEDPSNVAELHQMRIAAKRLRYTMEAFVPCFGTPLAEQIAEVKLLQEELGQVHDSDVWVLRLQAYIDGSEATDEQKHAVEQIIAERRENRDHKYAEAVEHWHRLVKQQFAEQVETLAGSEPALSNPEEERISNMEQEEKKEIAAETPAAESTARPARRRTTKPSVPAQPAAVKTVARRVRKPSTAKAGGNGEPALDVEPQNVVVTQEIPVEVAEAAVPVASAAEPQHPVVAELKELVCSATSRLAEIEFSSGSMSKQLCKVEKMLDDLPNRLRDATVKEATKAERWMGEMRDHLQTLSESKKLSRKKVENLRQDLRTLRKNLCKVQESKKK